MKLEDYGTHVTAGLWDESMPGRRFVGLHYLIKALAKKEWGSDPASCGAGYMIKGSIEYCANGFRQCLGGFLEHPQETWQRCLDLERKDREKVARGEPLG